MRAYLRSLNPQLPRDVWFLQAGGLVNMFGNGVIGPFLITYLHNVRGLSLGIAGLVVATGALTLERRIPVHLHLTPHMDSFAGVPGTMANMAPTTDEPLSTDAQPAPHPADETSRVHRGGRSAPGTTRR